MSGKFDLARLAEHPLTADEAAHIFGEILSGLADDKDIEAFLIALSSRKPAISEFVGAVTAMRAQMKGITAPPLAIDLCGTGGDGLGTLNISTAVSFVVAACGVSSMQESLPTPGTLPLGASVQSVGPPR